MPRKQKQYHYIYKTTNVVTGKYYYGMHSTDNLEDDYLGSGKRLRYSINKYGEENHKREILEFVENREELRKREKEIVNLNEIAKENCMNLIVGGEGGFTPEQQKINAIKSNEKQKWLRENNPEWKKKYSKNRSKALFKQYELGKRKKEYFYNWSGRKHNEETKLKIGKCNSLKQKGSGNSQYGSCWISNGKENKKIKKDDILPKDWYYGRIFIK